MPDGPRVDTRMVRTLAVAGIVVLVLAFVSAWTTAESAPGVPALGLVVATLLLAAAGVGSISSFVGRNARLPPEARKDGLGVASFVLFCVALGASFAAAVAAVAAPSGYPRTAHLSTVRDLMDACAFACILLAAFAFLVAWILGRAALHEGPGSPPPAGLAGWRAAVAPFLGSLSLAVALLVTPGFVKAVFSPVAARVEARHARGFFIAMEVFAALAGVAMAVFYSFR